MEAAERVVVQTFDWSGYLDWATGTEAALMAKKVAKPMREWQVSIIAAKSKYVGRVMASHEASAIEKAAEEYKIDPARRFRLIAEPVK